MNRFAKTSPALFCLAALLVVTALSSAAPSKAELELERRAKLAQQERVRQQQAAEFQALLAEAAKKGARQFDWSLVPAENDSDWKSKREALVARYKDAPVIVAGKPDKMFNRGTPQASFFLYPPARNGVKLLIFLRDLDDQKMIAPPDNQPGIKIVGTIRDQTVGKIAAFIDAELVGWDR